MFALLFGELTETWLESRSARGSLPVPSLLILSNAPLVRLPFYLAECWYTLGRTGGVAFIASRSMLQLNSEL